MNQGVTKRKTSALTSKNVKKPSRPKESKVAKQDLSSSFSTMSVNKRTTGSTSQTRLSNNSSNSTNSVNSIKKVVKPTVDRDLPVENTIEAPQQNENELTESVTFTKNGQLHTIKFVSGKAIGNGSFGVVFLARIVETSECVAIKKVHQDRRYKNRELEIMQMVQHPNVVEMKHHFFSYGPRKEVFLHLALEYVPDTVCRYTYSFTKQNDFMPLIYVKLFTYQMLRALNYIHSIEICHRDIKPQNLLIDPVTGVLKICDFGSAKQLIPSKANVAYICSRYYRAPELIFGATFYTTSIDTWSAGCVLGEMLLGHPLFPGESSINQLIQIVDVLGTPSKQEIEAMNMSYTNHRLPKVKPLPWSRVFKDRRIPVPDTAIDLLEKLLRYTPSERIKCIDSLAHPFFDELRDQSTRLPSGRPLPQLFNFTPNELKMSSDPNLKDRLIPEWHRKRE